jgi:DNA-binding LacI/PurR family transcriptional regulator
MSEGPAEGGSVRQEARRTTIADVATAAGVSKAAVSFAFNSPERLRAGTVERIRQVATELDYRPDPVARMLAQRRTGTVGILTPQALAVTFTNPYFAAFTAGVAGAAEAAGYAIQFISPLHGSLIRAVDRASVDGVIAVGLAADHPEVGQIRRSGIPFVLVDSTALPEEPSVSVDDEGGAFAAAEHLVALGHRAFLVIGVEPPTRGTSEVAEVGALRLRGYCRALGDAGIELPLDARSVAPTTIAGGQQAFHAAWDAGQRPTAVLAMSDVAAIGVLHAARELRLRVPDEVSVVGFDDIDLARYTDPPLTTVHQPIQEKGSEAVRLLFKGVARVDTGRPEHCRLETRLIVRASTGAVPLPRQEVVVAHT